MRRLLLALFVCALFVPAAAAADADFNAIVRGVESDLGISRLRIPFLGLASFFVKSAHPSGVTQLDFAIFEELHYSPPGKARFDAIVQRATGGRWQPIIQIRSDHGRECTYIYTRPDGRNWKLLLANFDRDDAVIIHLRATPEILLDALDQPDHATTRLTGGHQGR
jgi:hypothetical protein